MDLEVAAAIAVGIAVQAATTMAAVHVETAVETMAAETQTAAEIHAEAALTAAPELTNFLYIHTKNPGALKHPDFF